MFTYIKISENKFVKSKFIINGQKWNESQVKDFRLGAKATQQTLHKIT